ncbi:MAG: DUF1329 domain-containing protein [Desulfatitalea sp.]|nr:DUF1329 domain-containing protein [Desulfatitalea sp.]NNK00298.1 DUF1329 domain-containing protein [Desulfatitalea sp.]
MKKVTVFVICIWAVTLAWAITAPTLWAAEEFSLVTVKAFQKNKAFYDDPRPLYLSDAINYKKILPPEVYAELTYDVEAMKKVWAENTGFRAPDVVGKIAPEIKPGTYSYKDKDKYPGLKALMSEYHYNRFIPGGPPFAGNFPEIKIVPTKQYYYALPIAQSTKKHMGQTQLDDKTGLIKEETYSAGYPFPKPEGRFKANQIYYNWLKRYCGWDSRYFIAETHGWTGSLREDSISINTGWILRLKGRVMKPYGFFDDRAKAEVEDRGISVSYISPRDMYGNVISQILYPEPDKWDQMMLYIGNLRRVRIMSSTDVQDSVGGADLIYLDNDGCSQKLSDTIFPSKMEMVAELEMLLPTNHTGSAYLTSPSKGVEFHNLEWERRPVYVIKMIQLDKNFVYSYRNLYLDKETLLLVFAENYDKRNRLYRTYESILTFDFDMGMPVMGCTLAMDHIDLHSVSGKGFTMPTPWVGREKVGLEYLFKKGK